MSAVADAALTTLARTNAGPTAISEPGPEPPVVGRLIVEIRSDGSRTVARGGIEDQLRGERVSLEAQGTTPGQLALSLIRSMFSGPLLASVVTRKLLR